MFKSVVKYAKTENGTKHYDLMNSNVSELYFYVSNKQNPLVLIAD